MNVFTALIEDFTLKDPQRSTLVSPHTYVYQEKNIKQNRQAHTVSRDQSVLKILPLITIQMVQPEAMQLHKNRACFKHKSTGTYELIARSFIEVTIGCEN